LIQINTGGFFPGLFDMPYDAALCDEGRDRQDFH